MACYHLQQLYKLCQDQQIKLGGSDLIHVVCQQCGEQEVCPSMLVEEDDTGQSQQGSDESKDPSTDSDAGR